MNMFSMIAPNVKNFADQGLSRSTFVATNPTPGTGIASLDASTSRAATVGLMNVFNASNTDGTEPNVIIPVRLKLRATAVNTTASDCRLAFYLDSINRWSSGGTAITEVAPIDSNPDDGFTDPTSNATIYFGALTLAAASDETLIADELVMSTILAAGDTFDIWWGDAPGSIDTGAATGHPDTVTVVVPPMWIGPGADMMVHQYGTAQAADPAFEFTFWYLEVPNDN